MNVYVISAILAMAAATVVSRAAPFLFLGRVAERPPVRYVGTATPPIIVTLLVLYCLKDISLASAPYGLPEGIALALTIGLHFLWRNALVSIGCGTAVYMAIVQTGVLGIAGP